MAVVVSSWEKFKLLLWKNWLQQWSQKIRFLVVLTLPAILITMLVLSRLSVDIKHGNQTIYEEIGITNLAALQAHVDFPSFIAFSPENPLLEKIVAQAIQQIGIRYYNGFVNAESLQNELATHSNFAGVEFPDNYTSIKSYPEKFSFTLRFLSRLRTAPRDVTTDSSWHTDQLFPESPINYPRNPLNSDGGYPLNYVSEGFIPLQHAISMSYMRLAGKNNWEPEVVMQRFPYPAFTIDPLIEKLASTLVYFFMLSLVYPCMTIVKSIAYEKEMQLKEVMKIMGIPNWIHWCAWFVFWIVILSISCLLVLILLKVKFSNDVALITYSSWTVLYAFLLVYAISAICFCFMVAVFFTKASTAAPVVALLWILGGQPFTILKQKYHSLSLGQKLGWSLITNNGMGFGFKVIEEFEGTGEGLRWSNFLKPGTIDDDLSLGAVMLTMLVGSVIYLAICLYVEQIFPGEFGVPKKWNFIFSSETWCPRESNRDEDSSRDVMHRKHPEAFETEPHDKKIGVQVKNLRKKFGANWAVKNVSINMYEDEITVLLGHNGAGKTTTISMLTGMFPPNGGTAIINGIDIRNNIDGARASMGICPQHNVLFDDISVANHIVFFSRLKGLKGVAIQREVDYYLKIIDLEKKAKTRSRNLSGGMKRKLSICCALCGNTKVVLCDEPSSGMDPAARRQLWNLLQGEKNGRTILLTTHYMEEADVLGDRVAIMCEGEVKCHGTSFFLKKEFGTGYKLICVKGENCNVAGITNLLNKYIPDITPASDIGTELMYQLPDNVSTSFEAMFADLEKQSTSLGLSGYGISITSLEEVFMKIGAESSSKKSGDEKKNANDLESSNSEGIYTEKSQQSGGITLLRYQFEAMLIKNILYAWRNKSLLFIQIILVILFTVAVLLETSDKDSEAPMTISLQQYRNAFVVLDVAENVYPTSMEFKIGEKYADTVRSFGRNYKIESTDKISFIDYILALGKTIQRQVNSEYLAAATIRPGKLIAWLNNQPLHTAPLTLNLLHNAMAKVLVNPGSEIIVSNHPYKYAHQQEDEHQYENFRIGFALAFNVAMAMAFVTSMYALFIIKEKESRSKLLQYISGVRVWIFWLGHYLWDMCTFIFLAVLTIVIISFLEISGLTTFTELMRYFAILIVFGWAALPLTYLMSFCFSNHATGFSIISIFNLVSAIVLYMIVDIFLLIPSKKSLAETLIDVFRIFPHFSLVFASVKLLQNINSRQICLEDCKNVPYFDLESPGVLKEIIYMLVVGAVGIVLIIAFESRLLRQLNDLISTLTKPKMPRENGSLDPDVLGEKNRILSMTKAEIRSQNLVLDRVTKYYKKFLAVNSISLCVKKAECFGLLGVNGAGKTSTFKMMTGDESISYGVAYVKGMSLSKDMKKIYHEIGYCPQFDALLGDLTGRETLRIFCLLRGIPRHRHRRVTKELARSFGFSKHLDKPAKSYSGGTKRKLSNAIAVLGSSIIYLDEPTAGMDPEARRHLWNVVCWVRDSGKSIVLTSHSMEECEALCTRLAIMVNGEFQCIGSVQHLKNKFSKGLTIKLKIHKGEPLREEGQSSVTSNKRNSDNEENDTEDTNNEEENDEIMLDRRESLNTQLKADVRKVRQAVEERFSDAVLQEEYQGMLTYYIPLVGIRWSEIFGFIERNRQALNIEDFSISQTSLEEIFLQFANAQRGTHHHPST